MLLFLFAFSCLFGGSEIKGELPRVHLHIDGNFNPWKMANQQSELDVVLIVQ